VALLEGKKKLIVKNAIANLIARFIANKTGHCISLLTVPTAMQYKLT
jgi:hypothetical protein